MSDHPLFGHRQVLTPEQLATIATLTEDRWTAPEIAEHLGIPRDSVHRGRKVAGVIGHNPTHPGQPIDEMAVLRATWGDPVELNHEERTEAVRKMSGQGMSAAQIARALNVTRRTVERHVAKVRAA